MLDSATLPAWRTRFRRRLLAAGLAVLLLLAAGLNLSDSSVAGVGVLVALLCTAPLYFFLRHLLRGVVDVPTDELDERQLQNRGTYYLWAYRFLGLLIVPGMLLTLAVVRGASDDEAVSPGTLGGLIPAIFIIVSILPTMVAAWMEPDEVE